MLTNLLYIDPAAASALVVSISTILTALGAVFIVWWRKVKKKTCQILHIDENKNKEVEDELVITDEEIALEEQAEKAEAVEAVAEEATEEKVSEETAE